MRVLIREFETDTTQYRFNLVGLGDTHIGSANCDEAALLKTINEIAESENTYWICMGDVADFINVSDKRFDPTFLAPWIKTADLLDITRVQCDRFLQMIEPIASKCLAVIEGNHERYITMKYERNIHREIVMGIKKMGGFREDYQLSLGYCGWVVLRFIRVSGSGKQLSRSIRVIKVYAHHGFGGGKLAGSRALDMQRWIWTHEADITMFGHTHSISTTLETVEGLSRSHKPILRRRVGVHCGSFMKSGSLNHTAYNEVKGLLPIYHGSVPVIQIMPFTEDEDRRIRVML